MPETIENEIRILIALFNCAGIRITRQMVADQINHDHPQLRFSVNTITRYVRNMNASWDVRIRMKRGCRGGLTIRGTTTFDLVRVRDTLR